VKLVVGLGNPGPRYADTRHNGGFRVLDAFAAAHGVRLRDQRYSGVYGEGQVAGQRVGLLAPSTFMNRSGDAVAAAVRGLDMAAPESDLLVVYDDMDLPLGRIRLRKGGGAGGQNGIGHVIEALGTRAIPRIRFGIGRPPAGQDPIEYVLSPFEPGEADRLVSATERAAAAVAAFVVEGMDAAMNAYNRDPEPDPSVEPSPG
jgi:PTH1 family peptidyl-tRNA hydrolase